MRTVRLIGFWVLLSVFLSWTGAPALATPADITFFEGTLFYGAITDFENRCCSTALKGTGGAVLGVGGGFSANLVGPPSLSGLIDGRYALTYRGQEYIRSFAVAVPPLMFTAEPITLPPNPCVSPPCYVSFTTVSAPFTMTGTLALALAGPYPAEYTLADVVTVTGSGMATGSFLSVNGFTQSSVTTIRYTFTTPVHAGLSVVPEPGTSLLLLSGLALLLLLRRVRRSVA